MEEVLQPTQTETVNFLDDGIMGFDDTKDENF